jgi:HlyD family secretion protein
VRTIIPTADRQKATVKVRMSFDHLDPRILPDMGVKVGFLGEPVPATATTTQAHGPVLIPRGVVHRSGDATVVFLVVDGKVERRAVRLGAERGEDVEVVAGVSAGDTLIATRSETLQEGQAVQVKP